MVLHNNYCKMRLWPFKLIQNIFSIFCRCFAFALAADLSLPTLAMPEPGKALLRNNQYWN